MSKVRRIFYPPGTTPVNWKILANVFLSMLSFSMSVTLLFPFLPAMIKSFGISVEDTGYYAGLVASSMFIGRTVSWLKSAIWMLLWKQSHGGILLSTTKK
ncbi:uncharacterized protein [Montipora foliosa]|uniref:uncharacterized protein isoform X2 n=1 Tax=Montipora foliosa TaxID=591990 RepID=UPI0035F17DFB